MIRLASGDREAIQPTFEVLWPLVRAYCARALVGAGDAEDIAQQTIIRVFDRVADYDVARDPLAWVLTIARYECSTFRRRVQRRREQVLSPTEGEYESSAMADQRDPEGLIIERHLQEAARVVLCELGPEDRATVAMAMGLDGATTHDGDGTARATFRKRLQRALARLRMAWRTKHGID